MVNGNAVHGRPLQRKLATRRMGHRSLPLWSTPIDRLFVFSLFQSKVKTVEADDELGADTDDDDTDIYAVAEGVPLVPNDPAACRRVAGMPMCGAPFFSRSRF